VDRDLFKRRVLVYGSGTRAKTLSRLRRRSDRIGFQLVGFMSAEGEVAALAYREALAGGSTPLAEVLRRNAYGGRPPTDTVYLERLEAHVRQLAGQLAGMSRNDLAK